MSKYFFIFSLTIAVIFLSGCSDVNIKSDNPDIQSKQKELTLNNRPDRTADVVGIVKSIIGNEIIVNQVDMVAVRKEMQANIPKGSKPSEESSNLVDRGTRIPGMGGRMKSGSTSETREKMNEIMREHSLGDVKVLIPVGIPMYSRGDEASLVDLTVGDNITIWLNLSVKDRKIAEFVNL